MERVGGKGKKKKNIDKNKKKETESTYSIRKIAGNIHGKCSR